MTKKYEIDIVSLRRYVYENLERTCGKSFSEVLYDVVYQEIEDYIVDCEVEE